MRLQTVIEVPEYVKQVNILIDKQSQINFIEYIAGHPLDGDLIPGTGGARKIRWQGAKHKGKSGGIRVIYFFHDRNTPIFLLTAYGKGVRANLSNQEKNELRKILRRIVAIYKNGEGYE
jgi:hypothetical protein